eukprot:scaffold50868_cov59-Phaeocystis_antarctica.AAC.1
MHTRHVCAEAVAPVGCACPAPGPLRPGQKRAGKNSVVESPPQKYVHSHSSSVLEWSSLTKRSARPGPGTDPGHPSGRT